MGMIIFAAAVLFVLTLFTALCFRIVVPTNAVHIIQSSHGRKSFGGDPSNRNTYYRWPAWIPFIGVRVTVLPVSVFDKSLISYAAYDIDRVPFVIDVWAFFRIADPNMAAERVHSVQELMEQLEPILQGAARTILATSTITEIMGDRAVFGNKFTTEVKNDLISWGVEPVKSIELMDIRDADGSKVISNIMAKKKSFIEMESRTAVAENTQKAQVAEVIAAQTVQMEQQKALEAVGVRTAQKDQEIGMATQAAQEQVGVREAVKNQAVNVAAQKALAATQDEARNVAERTVAVATVQEVGKANIAKSVQIVQAEQNKQVNITTAEGRKQQTITVAEGDLAAAKLAAQGVQATGEAKGAAETALLMAPVNTQITLAKEIGANDGYQRYLVTVRTIDKDQVVGVAQAEALKVASIKIIANTGTPSDGIKTVSDLFSSRGGQVIGAALEGLSNTPTGRAVLTAITGDKS